jgi:hypothetical protein
MSDEELLQVVNRSSNLYSDEISLERATSANFRGFAIAREKDMVLLFGNDIGYSCSFEKKLSTVDKNLEALSPKGDILALVVNSVADTYSWSVFSKGKRLRVIAVEEKKVLFTSGEATKYENGMSMDDQGMLTLIENFTGYPFIDLVFEKNIKAAVYSAI